MGPAELREVRRQSHVCGNNEGAVAFLGTSFRSQQRPLPLLPRRRPISMRKYGLGAGGYCSQWRSPNNIFPDKCPSAETHGAHSKSTKVSLACVSNSHMAAGGFSVAVWSKAAIAKNCTTLVCFSRDIQDWLSDSSGKGPFLNLRRHRSEQT